MTQQKLKQLIAADNGLFMTKQIWKTKTRIPFVGGQRTSTNKGANLENFEIPGWNSLNWTFVEWETGGFETPKRSIKLSTRANKAQIESQTESGMRADCDRWGGRMLPDWLGRK